MDKNDICACAADQMYSADAVNVRGLVNPSQ